MYPGAPEPRIQRAVAAIENRKASDPLARVFTLTVLVTPSGQIDAKEKTNAVRLRLHPNSSTFKTRILSKACLPQEVRFVSTPGMCHQLSPCDYSLDRPYPTYSMRLPCFRTRALRSSCHDLLGSVTHQLIDPAGPIANLLAGPD